MMAHCLWLLLGATALAACERSEPAAAGENVHASDEAVLQCSVDTDCMTNRICNNGQCSFAEKDHFLIKEQVGKLYSAIHSGRTVAGNHFTERGSCPRSNLEVSGCKNPDGGTSVGGGCPPPFRKVSFEEAALNEYTESARIGITKNDDCLVEGVASDTADTKIRGKKIVMVGRRNAEGRLDWQTYSNIEAKYLWDTVKQGLPDEAFAESTYPTSFDCLKATSIPEKLICHDPDLAASDLELAAVVQRAKAVAYDKKTFTEMMRNQWNDRQQNCMDKPCIVSWYAHRMTDLNQIAQTGHVPGGQAYEGEGSRQASEQQQRAQERLRNRGIDARREREETREQPAAQQWTADQIYEARRGECARGFFGTNCRNKIKAQLCQEHWSNSPAEGFKICKQGK